MTLFFGIVYPNYVDVIYQVFNQKATSELSFNYLSSAINRINLKR